MNYKQTNILHTLILLAYGFLAVLTPRFAASDSAGPKFLALGALNLAVLIYLLFRKDQKTGATLFKPFFKNRIGIVYALFMTVSLLSFFKAGNQAEFIITFVKLFTVFNAVILVSYLIREDPGKLFTVALAMTLLLLFDSVMVYIEIKRLAGEHRDFLSLYMYYVNTVSAGYSNKNILASALFMKIPFALWLFTFRKKWIRLLALIVIFLAVIALVLLGARAFYLGIAIITASYFLYLILRLLTKRIRWRTATRGFLVLLVVVAVGLTGSVLVGKFFPQLSRFNVKERIAERMETIRTDVSSGTRIASWMRSARLIGEEPVMGVGLGNWKIRVLKEENRVTPRYEYYFYNHNDFIEMTAQTGIFGGSLYLVLVLLPLAAFTRSLFKGEDSVLSYRLLFLPAFGALAYSIDAFFNFPHDRPEIQSLWILFTGAAIALTPPVKPIGRLAGLASGSLRAISPNRTFSFTIPRAGKWGGRRVDISSKMLLTGGYLLLIVFSLYPLLLNVRSLQLQSLYLFELENKAMKASSTVFLEGFPAVPSIAQHGDPVAAIKARYLINENDYAGAITVLLADRSSPWDTRREYLLSIAYQSGRQTDEAIRYGLRVFSVKPFYVDNLKNLIAMYESREQYAEASDLIGRYLAAFDSLGQGLEGFLKTYGDDRPDYIRKQAALQAKAAVKRAEPEYTLASYYFSKRDLRKAAVYWDRVLEKEPDLKEAREKRARCGV